MKFDRKWLTGCLVHRWETTGISKTLRHERCRDCGRTRTVSTPQNQEAQGPE